MRQSGLFFCLVSCFDFSCDQDCDACLSSSDSQNLQISPAHSIEGSFAFVFLIAVQMDEGPFLWGPRVGSILIHMAAGPQLLAGSEPVPGWPVMLAPLCQGLCVLGAPVHVPGFFLTLMQNLSPLLLSRKR